MGWTTIRYRGAEFVANDLPIEVWLLAVVRRIDADAGSDRWLGEIREEWHLQATSGFGFGPTPALDRFLDSDERRVRVAAYFRRALDSLTSGGRDEIPADELARSGVGGTEVFYTRGLPTRMVVEVGEQFLALVSRDAVDDGAGP